MQFGQTGHDRGFVAGRGRASGEAIAAVLGKMHADKAVTFEAGIPDDRDITCEAQDFDEIVGNILDNAFKWAKTRVAIVGCRAGRMAELVIEDDGPGIQGDPAALLPRKRLGETAPGFGFGLTIARTDGTGLLLSIISRARFSTYFQVRRRCLYPDMSLSRQVRRMNATAAVDNLITSEEISVPQRGREISNVV